jgi:hypothetical protein
MSQVDFRDGMDPHSLDIRIDNKLVGYLQWHKGPFTIIMWETGVHVPIDDLTRKVAEVRERQHRASVARS